MLSARDTGNSPPEEMGLPINWMFVGCSTSMEKIERVFEPAYEQDALVSFVASGIVMIVYVNGDENLLLLRNNDGGLGKERVESEIRVNDAARASAASADGPVEVLHCRQSYVPSLKAKERTKVPS